MKLFFTLLCAFWAFGAMAQTPETELLRAVKANNLPTVQDLVGKGANVNMEDFNKTPLIFWAVMRGDVSLVRYLVSQKANTKTKNALFLPTGAYYGSLLAIASAENKMEMLRYLVEELGLPVNQQEYNPEEKLDNGWTPLQWACQNGHADMITYLLGKGADVNLSSLKGSLPLFLVLASKKSAPVLALLQSAVNLEQGDNENTLPIFYAIAYQEKAVLQKMIEKGADFKNVKLDKNTPFHYALQRGKIEHAQLLLEKGADGAGFGADNTLPLCVCAKNGFEDLVKLLLKNKVNPNTPDNAGRVPLMYAAFNNQVDICKLLIEAKADKNLQDKEGKTALDYARQNNVADAIAYLENPKNYKPLSTWQTYNQKLVMFINAQQGKQAMEVSQQALAYVGKEHGEKSEQYAQALMNHVRLLRNIKEQQQALPFLEKVFPLLEGKKDEQSLRYLEEAKTIWGKILFEIGQYEKAKNMYAQMEEGYLKNVNMGDTHYKLSQFVEAESYFKKAYRLAKDVQEQLSMQIAFTTLYMDMGLYASCDSIFQKALPTAQKLYETDKQKYIFDYLTIKHNYADYLTMVGKYDKAEYEERWVLKTIEAWSRDNALYHQALMTLGVICLEMGRYEEATQYLSQAAYWKYIALGKEHPSFARALMTLGTAHLYLNDKVRAEYYYGEALQIVEKTEGKGTILYASILTNQATLYREKNNLPTAERLMHEAMALMEKNNLTNTPYYAKQVGNFANILQMQEKYKEAIAWSEKSLALYKQNLPENHVDYFREMQDLALAYATVGKEEQAETYMMQSMQGIRSFTEKIFFHMNEKQQTAYTQHSLTNLEAYQQYVIERSAKKPQLLGDLLDYTLAMKGIFLNVQNKVRKEILTSQDTVNVAKFKEWVRLKETLNKHYNKTPTELRALNISLPQIEREAEQMEVNMAQAVAQKIKPQRITWKDIQRTLKANEVAIETINLHVESKDSTWYAFLLFDKNSSLPEAILVRNGDELEGKYFKNYLNTIKGKAQDKYSYEQYWSPLLKSKLLQGGKKTIYFSPEGVYHQISLSGLRNPATDKYLMDEHNLQVISSLKDLLQTAKEKNTNEAVFLGYPKYNLPFEAHEKAVKAFLSGETATALPTEAFPTDAPTRTIRNELSNLDLGELPGTKTEVENISGIATQNGRKVKTYLGEQALEEVVKQTKNPSILHISTHGYFLKDVKESGEGGKLLGILTEKLQENPLLRAGLLLTGASNQFNSSTPATHLENGILTAYEAMHLELDNTDLVVLSACETGVGEVKAGEGIYGLQRAFKLAGAKALLMSLWTVSDEATQVLMTAFYKQWLKGKSAVLAFRIAQNEVRKRYPHPYYWAAFVLIGGERL